ncbi:BgTH12-06598 [Blumeria graminis f. sp. triticale]|uniref:BgTH12-06598 n=1 Tax=Blumeria graminis f. sp. triticale TaxID=1689686 RepID=A0A9W4DFL9_BLUGR|nr:BgTH12-06598 [Blumeria graminis f. sp. triticale]
MLFECRACARHE